MEQKHTMYKKPSQISKLNCQKNNFAKSKLNKKTVLGCFHIQEPKQILVVCDAIGTLVQYNKSRDFVFFSRLSCPSKHPLKLNSVTALTRKNMKLNQSVNIWWSCFQVDIYFNQYIQKRHWHKRITILGGKCFKMSDIFYLLI